MWNKCCNTTQGELQPAALLLKANEACFVTPQTATANYLIKGYHCNDLPAVGGIFYALN